ncbi:hypothetical protein HK096_006764, partial [Nowakowskiella sp. JEL0078]
MHVGRRMNTWEIPRNQVTFANEDLIADGRTSAVYLGHWLSTPVAIKVLRRHINQDLIDSIKKEVDIAYHLRHPHVIQVYCPCLESQPMLVLEYAPLGTLHEVNQCFVLDTPSANQYILEIALGMQYLHTRTPPVLHGNLKSVNVLVAEGGKLKLTDFWLAKVKSVSTTFHTARGVSGTLRWLAPERLQRSKMSESADVYSFGMIMYEIVSEGKLPFELDGLENDPQIMMAIMNQQRPSRPTTLLCSDKLWVIMEDCWKHDQNIRPTFPQIVACLEPMETGTLNRPVIIAPSSYTTSPISSKETEIDKPLTALYQLMPTEVDSNETIMFLDHQPQIITNPFAPFPAKAFDSQDTVEIENLEKSPLINKNFKKAPKTSQILRKYWKLLVGIVTFIVIGIVVATVVLAKGNVKVSDISGTITTTSPEPKPTIPNGTLIRNYTGHTDYVSSVTVLPGTPPRLFSGSYDNTVKEWDISTGTLIRNYTGHTDYVFSVTVLPVTPLRLFSGSFDKTVKEWDISTGTLIHNYTGNTDYVSSVTVLPGTTPRFFSGSSDNTVKEWDISTVLPVTPLRLFSGSFDKTVKEWDISTGTLIRNYTGHTDYVFSVIVLPGTPPRLFSGSSDNTVKEWDIST